MNRPTSWRQILALLLLASGLVRPLRAQNSNLIPRQGAALLKTDILGVFAHPDDETGMAAALAYYALGRTSVVAHVYCTRGEGGGNMVGTQSGAALGALREAELRDCLAILGVRYCYFLDQLDWAYTESVAATLRKWGKEDTLERLVRMVRSLRPEIILTMNPAPTPGQHGHHQAAGVLATEAFRAAADPKRFPWQLSKEGLSVWQPRKLFFSGGLTNQIVSTITVSEPLPDGRTPAQVAGRALANHRSQAFGNFINSPWLLRPQRFTLVKSFVNPAGTEHDLLAGLPAAEIPQRPLAIATPPPRQAIGLKFVPRPAFASYTRWVSEQDIEHVAATFRADLPVVAGEVNEVKLELANAGSTEFVGELQLAAPAGWLIQPNRQQVRLGGIKAVMIPLRVTPPADARADVELKAVLRQSHGLALETLAKAHPLPRARVPKIRSAPALDGSDRGWEKVAALPITPELLVQGKVADAADSSATFRVAHHGQVLFLDVLVRDDIVVTNIAPDDIKGHWRSDSVEICLDPAGGAEDTMGCYKLGIFPFATDELVRAARDADAHQGPVEETAPKTRLTSQRTAEGYRIQAAIPFAEIGLKRGQKRIGFNLIIYDGDKRNAALGGNINKSRLAWAPRSGVPGRPEDWGRIDLE